MPTFEHDVELEIPASATWGALKDQNDIFPKIMPEAIASIEIVEGEGGPGSVRLVKYGPLSPDGGHLKEKIVSLDLDKHTVVSEEIEGGHLAQFGFSKWVQTLQLISTGDKTSKLHFSFEFEGGSEETIAKAKEITKQAVTGTFKALEKHVKGSA